MEGTIKSFNSEKGYGFISPPGERDVFFHVTSLAADIDLETITGRRVEFEIVETEKGPAARGVRPAR